MMRPPQSPRPRRPTGWSLVKTIGAVRGADGVEAAAAQDDQRADAAGLADDPRAGLDVQRARPRGRRPRRAARSSWCLIQVSVPVTSPVTTMTGLSMPGTFTGGAWSADSARPAAAARAGGHDEPDDDA